MGHKSQDELDAELKKAQEVVEVGGSYYHFKHPEQYYVVEFVGVLESCEEVCVGYRGLYGKGILWVRTLENFVARIEVGGKSVRRFQLVK